jgi:hypothetical protein
MKIAFFTKGTAFTGDTLSEKGLGGGESTLAYIARVLAKLGNKVTVFNNCDIPGQYSGVEYKHFFRNRFGIRKKPPGCLRIIALL